jgi:hypothetical protein
MIDAGESTRLTWDLGQTLCDRAALNARLGDHNKVSLSTMSILLSAIERTNREN